MRSRLMLLVGAGVLLTACEDTSSPSDEARVSVAMSAQSSAATSGTTNPINANGDLVLTGTNGVLTITDVKLVVSEFELKRDNDDDCEEVVGSDDDCEEFESAPFLVDLPLNGSEVVVATDRVPAGTYTEMEFEIEDLDDDADDSAGNRTVIQQLRTQLRAAYPGISDDASVIVVGTFTPVGGQARPFTVFLDADIEVEMALNPPLTISESGANRTVTLSIDPALWFRSNGQVLDLSDLNGDILEFEVEVEDGFTKIEWDD